MRTGISLAVLVAATAGASAQMPLGNPTPPAPPTAPGPAAQPNRRMVLMQKPAAPTTPNKVVLLRKPGEGAPSVNKTGQSDTPDKPTDDKTATKPKQPGNRTRLDVSRLESDEELLQRLTKELLSEARERAKQQIPPRPEPDAANYQSPAIAPLVPEGTPYVTKPVREAYPAMRTLIEPDYVVHRRMYFEEKNSERFGWDLGIAQPVVSALYFYKDVLLWPAELASNPFERYDTSAGKCLPGSPVPYYLYPPEVDLFGATVGAATIVGVAAILP